MADEREQDGLGRDAAHGDDRSATSGGSYGRNTGRSGDDLLETGERAQDDQGGRRRGLDGRGFDAGTGYGGGGNDSAYSRKSSYGGQAGSGGTSGGEGAEGGRSIPRGTDEHSDAGTGGRGTTDDDAVDLDVRPEVGWRDPTR
ncbi:hypothetical protein [Roseisolibacter sp. H3M3-2]|uniref:hypothetical protein n=1 Tax=Roseisolibacter sp. H3M3-2 TaxID=3031323 RepID=UPI0023DB30A6|nr:hypothetical protein [Roseisolibacter sp. H3M3-2]MDF1501458.1 hypothetical protein [Roseisolibacter sp. H3M3-2]